MDKIDFLSALQKGLSGLPQDDIDRSIDYYSEMIDDMTEEGMSEEEAVAALGTLEDIVKQIISEIPLTKLVKEKIKPKKRLGALEILLLILGSPIWLSLLIAAFAVMISIYAVLWSVIISLWSVFASFVACALGGIAAGIVFICLGNPHVGIAMIGAGIFCAGLSILLFFACREATKGIIFLTKKCALGIKNLFIKKGDAK